LEHVTAEVHVRKARGVAALLTGVASMCSAFTLTSQAGIAMVIIRPTSWWSPYVRRQRSLDRGRVAR